jgi:MFS family permease
MQNSSYSGLLRDRGFQCFLWTQFLAAFNDNLFKMIVSVAAVAYTVGNPEAGSRYLALTGAVFVLPFLLLAGWAGQLADRFSKSQVLMVTKASEILTMILALFALHAANMPALLAILFLLATQANFFSPAKYGILPEMLPERDLLRANALLELSTNFLRSSPSSSVGASARCCSSIGSRKPGRWAFCSLDFRCSVRSRVLASAGFPPRPLARPFIAIPFPRSGAASGSWRATGPWP